MSKSGYAITWTSKIDLPGSGFIECDDKSGTPRATFAQREERIWTGVPAIGNVRSYLAKPKISNSPISRLPERAGRGLFHTSRTRSSRPAWASTRRGSSRTRKTIRKNPSTWSRSWYVRNAGRSRLIPALAMSPSIQAIGVGQKSQKNDALGRSNARKRLLIRILFET